MCTSRDCQTLAVAAWSHRTRLHALDAGSRREVRVMPAKPRGTFKPGQKVPVSGQVIVRGTKTEKTVVKNEPFPPTGTSGQTYKYVDVTKHKK